jgi:tetratricopeptide (TPR) repeat protein
MVAEDYSEAIKIYESILNIGYESSELYYNLGNGYFRLELIGNSIWAYMNALDMAPRDRDIIYNLSIVNMRTIDRIEIPETFIFLKIYRKIKLFLTVYEWFLLGGILLISYSLWHIGIKFGFITGKASKVISSLLISLVMIVHIIAMDCYFEKHKRKTAVVISNGIDAYSGPFYGNNSLVFQINEGSLVDVSNEQKDWAEVVLVDGKKGWVPSQSIRFTR